MRAWCTARLSHTTRSPLRHSCSTASRDRRGGRRAPEGALRSLGPNRRLRASSARKPAAACRPLQVTEGDRRRGELACSKVGTGPRRGDCPRDQSGDVHGAELLGTLPTVGGKRPPWTALANIVGSLVVRRPRPRATTREGSSDHMASEWNGSRPNGAAAPSRRFEMWKLSSGERSRPRVFRCHCL